jgi:hypothetical protein
MVASASFESAPTMRFLRALDKVRALPVAARQKVAASVYAEIRPHIGSEDLDEIRAAMRLVQDERWRMISAGPCKMDDVRFASVLIAEQWLRAHIELVREGAPIAEILAQKRRDSIEEFMRDNLYADSGVVLDLHAYASARRTESRDAAKTAA